MYLQRLFQIQVVAALLTSLSSGFSPPMIRPGGRASRFSSPGGQRLLTLQLKAMKVTIRIVGRKSGGEKWLEEACSIYQTRLRPSGVEVETEWHKSDEALVKGVEGDYSKGNSVVLLDPKGKSYTSEKLAVDVYKWLETGGSRLVFVIGGGM
jgi:hypothetical protein